MFIHRTIYNISLFSYHRQFVTSTWWWRRTATASTRDAGVVGYYCQCPRRSRSWFSSSPARSLSCIKCGIFVGVIGSFEVWHKHHTLLGIFPKSPVHVLLVSSGIRAIIHKFHLYCWRCWKDCCCCPSLSLWTFVYSFIQFQLQLQL